MNQQLQISNTSPFESIKQVEDGFEYWSARDLQTPLGYARWENFEESIDRAMISCQNNGYNPEEHFRDATKIVKAGVASKPIEDFHLTRFACYLTAMNGDPRKPEIASAQMYFAIKTREAEIAQEYNTTPVPAMAHIDLTGMINQLETDIVHKQTELLRDQGALDHLKQAQMILTGDVPKITSKTSTRIIPQQDHILRLVKKLTEQEKPPTIRDLSRYLPKMRKEKTLAKEVHKRVELGLLKEDTSFKSPRYEVV